MASIRDIAKMAEVSPASVSRILNNDPKFHINENTRKRVIKIAKELNYSKYKNKSGAKRKQKLTIGLILRPSEKWERNDPYFENIHDGIIEEAKKWHLNTQLVFRIPDPDKDLDQLSEFAAIIIIGQLTDKSINVIRRKNKNIILIDANPTLDNCNYIRNDYAEMINKIMDHLYDLGHRNIIYIGGSSSIVDLNENIFPLKYDDRERFYKKWMNEKNLDQYSHTYISDSWSIKKGLELCNQMLDELADDLPTAIVVGSDSMALGIYKSLSNHKIKIPEDISIVSFDDLEMNRYLTPSLSSVYINSNAMGRTAVRLAKDLIIEPEIEEMPLVITCRSKLKLRESVGENLHKK